MLLYRSTYWLGQQFWTVTSFPELWFNGLLARMHLRGWVFGTRSKDIEGAFNARTRLSEFLHVQQTSNSLNPIEIIDHPALFSASGIPIDEYLKEVARRMPLTQSSFRLTAIKAASFQHGNNFPYKSRRSRFWISNFSIVWPRTFYSSSSSTAIPRFDPKSTLIRW